MMNLSIYFFIAVPFTICTSNGYKILGIFPLPAISHFTCNHAIMKSLIDAGHDVTVITAFPEQASTENYTSIIDIAKNEFIYVGRSSYYDFARLGVFGLLDMAKNAENPYCHKVMNLAEIKQLLNSKEKLYDAIFIEVLFLYKCFLAIAAKMDIPVIGTVTVKSWLYADHAIGNPNNPAFVPYDLYGALKRENFRHRLFNTWNILVSEWFWYFHIETTLKHFHEEYKQQLGPYIKYKNIEPVLIFYNNHPSLLPRPTIPNAIEIGGIHVKEAKPLPEDIQKFINEAEHGVILFSFGSIVRAASLTVEIQKAFKRAFAEIPQRVIWKFEEQMEDVPNNVMLIPWLPQRDILEHKNVKAFISHCGQGGTYEAMYSGTPIISCPLFGDQPGNAALLEDLEVAVHLDIDNISKENVLQALNLIINDTRFFNNMQKLSKVFKDRPMSPQQSVVYWTEYVIRHKGAPHLQTAAIHLKWFQYLLLDVISFVAVFLAAIIFFAYKIFGVLKINFLKMMYRFSRNYKNKSI